MKHVKIHKIWIDQFVPSEALVIAFLNYFQDENGASFKGARQEIWKQMKEIVSLGTVCAGISRAKTKDLMEVIGKTKYCKTYKVLSINRQEYFTIPTFLFFSNKFSPLEKLLYGYISSGFTPTMTKEKILEDLGIKGQRYCNKDLKHLVDENMVVLVDGKYYRANALKEENFNGMKEWHSRYWKQKFSFVKFIKDLWKKIRKQKQIGKRGKK